MDLSRENTEERRKGNRRTLQELARGVAEGWVSEKTSQTLRKKNASITQTSERGVEHDGADRGTEIGEDCW